MFFDDENSVKAAEVLIQECRCHRLSLLPRAEGTMIEVEVEVEDGESKETKRNSSKAYSAQKEKRKEKMKRKDEDKDPYFFGCTLTRMSSIMTTTFDSTML